MTVVGMYFFKDSKDADAEDADAPDADADAEDADEEVMGADSTSKAKSEILQRCSGVKELTWEDIYCMGVRKTKKERMR